MFATAHTARSVIRPVAISPRSANSDLRRPNDVRTAGPPITSSPGAVPVAIASARVENADTNPSREDIAVRNIAAAAGGPAAAGSIGPISAGTGSLPAAASLAAVAFGTRYAS